MFCSSHPSGIAWPERLNDFGDCCFTKTLLPKFEPFSCSPLFALGAGTPCLAAAAVACVIFSSLVLDMRASKVPDCAPLARRCASERAFRKDSRAVA